MTSRTVPRDDAETCAQCGRRVLNRGPTENGHVWCNQHCYDAWCDKNIGDEDASLEGPNCYDED